MFNDLKIKKEALPSNIPIFALTGTTLMPGLELPLNIFEPKYINMVDDALAEKKLIGLVQPKQGIFSKIRKNKPLYKIGCVGKIKAFNETEDGRYLIVINGLCRFNLEDEISTMRGYRRFKVAFDNYLDDFDIEKERKLFISELSKEKLFDKVDKYFFESNGEQNTINSYEAFGKVSDAFIIDFVSAYMPFSPQEKQSLLECKTIEERAKHIYKILRLSETKSELDSNITVN